MRIDTATRLLPTTAAFAATPALAVPIEGDLGNHAAALLVALGVSALFLSFRNLRDLRHKRIAPPRPQQDAASDGD
ncbi:MAG: hypothetical protein KDI82_03555 [Gammaproteobacteria bacterium]|nr:hypothetical protein [Gammaproteobacteria bacterium]